MKVKILGGVIVLAVLSIVVYKAASKNQSPRLEGIPHKNQVSWRVEKAKKDGLNRIELEPPTIDYLGAEDSDLNSALQSYSVVVATPDEEYLRQFIGPCKSRNKSKSLRLGKRTKGRTLWHQRTY